MALFYFCTESPFPTETDEEDEDIFDKILKVNKGNATKSLFMSRLSVAFLG